MRKSPPKIFVRPTPLEVMQMEQAVCFLSSTKARMSFSASPKITQRNPGVGQHMIMTEITFGEIAQVYTVIKAYITVTKHTVMSLQF